MKPDIRLNQVWMAGFGMLILAGISCEMGNLPPVARMTAFPPIGDTLTIFEFRAGESADDRNYPKGLMCRWDFNGDGQWDTGYDQSKTATRQFIDPGIYAVAVEVKDLDGLTSVARDTVVVIGMNREVGTLTDTRDGSRYRIVKILDRWWMAENLHYGTEIPVDRIQTNNGIVEMYRNTGHHSPDSSGGVYHWLEAMNYQVRDPQGICPDGWHIPGHAEWDAIFAPYPYMYAQQYYGRYGLSKLDLDNKIGATRWADGSFWWSLYGGPEGEFWTSSYKVLNNEYHPYCADFNAEVDGIHVNYWTGDNILEGGEHVRYFPLRCIKNN